MFKIIALCITTLFAGYMWWLVFNSHVESNYIGASFHLGGGGLDLNSTILYRIACTKPRKLEIVYMCVGNIILSLFLRLFYWVSGTCPTVWYSVVYMFLGTCPTVWYSVVYMFLGTCLTVWYSVVYMFLGTCTTVWYICF